MSQNQTDKHKSVTKTVKNLFPPTLLVTHGDQQEQNECHQVEDLTKKAGKEENPLYGKLQTKRQEKTNVCQRWFCEFDSPS